MKKIIDALRDNGIHILMNQQDILMECPDIDLDVDHLDQYICELIREVNRSEKQTRILFQAPKNIVNNLLFTKSMTTSIGERALFRKELHTPLPWPFPMYAVWPINDVRSTELLAEVMGVTRSSASRFLDSIKEELPSQAEKMYTVYLQDGEVSGIVFPHIEPMTNCEGRLFWIGVHPKYRGKGYGRALHQLGLMRLQKDFQARTYLGSTEVTNKKMIRIMQNNGCHIINNRLVTLEWKKKTYAEHKNRL